MSVDYSMDWTTSEPEGYFFDENDGSPDFGNDYIAPPSPAKNIAPEWYPAPQIPPNNSPKGYAFTKMTPMET